MKIIRVVVEKFRNIKSLTFCPTSHNILIGQVNFGKSTLLNAMALVLDPDTGRRDQAVDEIDFYGRKLIDDGKPIPLSVEITLAGCSEAERNTFLDYWEAWDKTDIQSKIIL